MGPRGRSTPGSIGFLESQELGSVHFRAIEEPPRYSALQRAGTPSLDKGWRGDIDARMWLQLSGWVKR